MDANKFDHIVEKKMSRRLAEYKQQVYGKKGPASYDVEEVTDSQGTYAYYPVVNGSIIKNNHYPNATDALIEARRIAVRSAN